MNIPAGTELWFSKLGAKGFIYPSEASSKLKEPLFAVRASFVYPKEYGLVPIKASLEASDGKIDESIFWIKKEDADLYVKSY